LKTLLQVFYETKLRSKTASIDNRNNEQAAKKNAAGTVHACSKVGHSPEVSHKNNWRRRTRRSRQDGTHADNSVFSIAALKSSTQSNQLVLQHLFFHKK
jgi:hypothetical protein